jgi:protein ImuB
MRTPSSPRRYLSIWLRRLATDRITRRASEPTQASYSRLAQPNSPISNESEIGASLVVVHPLKSALRLAAVNDAAARLGLKIGMALADARAMYPSLTVAESDVEADRRLLAAVADWCDRYTPLVGIDAPDGIMLDVTGCAHLFGGETALARDIVQRLAAQGLCARAAIADTAGCAWGVARYGVSVIPAEREAREPESISISTDRDYGFRVRGLSPAPRNDENFGHVVVPSARMREALAPLPTAALRLAPEIVAALAEVGLKRVADLLDLPRAALAARFGEILICRLDQALGREDEPITPRLPVPSYMVEQPFAEPIALERDVLGTIERLAQRLGRAMEQRHAGARRLEAALFRTDGEVHRIEVGTSAPTRDAARVTRLFADRLAIADACDPGFGYDLVRLSALHAERCEPVQTGLATPDDTAEMFHLIDRLGARFGLRRVTRLVPQDTHIPEFAAAALPAHGVR